MGWNEARDAGIRTRDAVAAATSQARDIVGEADRTADDALRGALERTAGRKSEAIRSLREAREDIAARTDRTERELRRFSQLLREVSETPIQGAASR